MKKKSYEASFKRLEEIMEKLENQQLGLEESLTLFQEGIDLYRQCREQLNKAEETLKVVMAESGLETLKPLREEGEES
ncbi:MAG: exodeoxyribonuclease VII small subunit [Bacillota bacterium]|nr:exodeoxyribonuclease VII small subunit [Bacillota bacterium]MDW7678299.1 exodeoxyribonuclease VII small subunit [Bacillota bacterium]